MPVDLPELPPCCPSNAVGPWHDSDCFLHKLKPIPRGSAAPSFAALLESTQSDPDRPVEEGSSRR